ncbi:hypothetical protein BGX31_002024 [Mortierella sp. GBA43]|nr:hypothetical protein BGX31_002024 [Mortierella sp. GBA43]
MLSRSIVPVPKGALSLHQALDLCNVYLEGAYKTPDQDVALFHAKNAHKELKDAKYQDARHGIAAAFIHLGRIMELQGHGGEAELIRRKTEKWGARSQTLFCDQLKGLQGVDPPTAVYHETGRIIATVASHLFPKNVQPPNINIKLPGPDERLTDTLQLACCLGLLQAACSSVNTLEPEVHEWLQIVEKDTDEQERLHAIATDVLRAYRRDELKDAKAVAEVVCLAPVLTKDPYRDMIKDFCTAIDQSRLLDAH